MKQLVLVGGGHSHVEVLKRFATCREPSTRITLISPHASTPYSGMIPGFIAGHYWAEECFIDLVSLARSAGAEFIQASVNGMHLDARLTFCSDGRNVPYDLASIDVGSRPETIDAPGAASHALSIKPIERFLQRWQELAARAARLPEGYRILVVGGGAGGVESLLAMQYRLQTAGAREVRFSLATDGEEILPTHSPRVRRAFLQVLRKRAVEVHAGRPVIEVRAGAAVLAGGRELSADLIIWATGAGAPCWPGACGLVTDRKGFVLVNEALQSVNRPEVFAAGDVAEMQDSPRPKSGVYAVRQGPPLAENLRHALRGERLRPYRAQRQALALISTGNRYAVASRGPLTFRGKWVWRWKNRIDRRFMQRYA